MDKLMVEMHEMLKYITYTESGECSICGADAYYDHEEDCELMLLLKKIEESKNV